MTQGVAVKEQVETRSAEHAESIGPETDGRISLSRLMGVLRRRHRQRAEPEIRAAERAAPTGASQTPSAVVTRLEADIAELERRLQALEDDADGQAEQARMLQLLLRNRKDVLERAKARKFLLDGASYGVK